MKGTLVTVSPNGVIARKTLNGPASLEVLQATVGGHIECVPYFSIFEHDGKVHECVVFCNEEGKLDGLPVNEVATLCWEKALKSAGHPGLLKDGQTVDVLVGDIAILYGDEEFMEAL